MIASEQHLECAANLTSEVLCVRVLKVEEEEIPAVIVEELKKAIEPLPVAPKQEAYAAGFVFKKILAWTLVLFDCPEYDIANFIGDWLQNNNC